MFIFLIFQSQLYEKTSLKFSGVTGIETLVCFLRLIRKYSIDIQKAVKYIFI